MNNAVESILAVVAPAVLLVIPRAEKGPRKKGWSQHTLADMERPEYLASLNHGGNIGVLLGKASNGLCTVDLDHADAEAAFLECNPKLATALRTTRVRGGNVWVRVAGEFPAKGDLKARDPQTGRWRSVGEWRSDDHQTVIHGSAMDAAKGETQPTAYRRVVDAPPAELANFEEIHWPADWWLPWLPEPNPERELTEAHGAAFTVSGRGRVEINPMFFVARFEGERDVLFEPGEGRFYAYHADTGLWRPETTATVKVQFAADLKRYADGQEPDVGEQLVNARSDKFLAGLVALLQGHAERREAFTRRAGVVHVANGMLHLADADPPELRPFGSAYLSRNAAPVAYSPDADCPRFRAELLESALDADDVSLVQRYCGALLLGRNLAQKILALIGTAGGGKSTLLEIVEKIVGLENVGQLRTELLAERFETARFLGKTLLTGKDVAGRFLETPGAHVLKALVGHDLLDAERKGSNASFQVRGDFGVVITCNSRLRVRLDGDAEAWRRRLLIVRYERPRPERPERDFAGRLLVEEGPGILAWMVAGARAHLAELETTGEFALTPRQRGRVNALLAESDSVREFVRQRTEVCPGVDVTGDELAEAYAGYCDAMGWEALPVRRVQREMGDAMQEVRRAAQRTDIYREGKARRGFSKVRLLPEANAGEAAGV